MRSLSQVLLQQYHGQSSESSSDDMDERFDFIRCGDFYHFENKIDNKNFLQEGPDQKCLLSFRACSNGQA